MTIKSLMLRSLYFLFLLSLMSSCQDPILVGGTLLEDEKLDLGVTSDFDLSTIVIEGERIITHQSNINSRTYLLGELKDDIFGTILAELSMKFKLGPSKPSYQAEEKIRFDSLVLILQYDTLGTYGGSSGAQSVKVFQLEETFKGSDTFYSDTMLKYLSTEIGKLDKVINPKDSVKIIDHLTGKTVTQGPQLRIRLNNSFGESLINNADAAKNDTLFGEFFKGIHITSSSLNGDPFMYGINLNDAAINSQSPINKMIMYYTAQDTIEKTYEYFIDRATINRFAHDRTGKQVASFIENPMLGDSLCFIQGIGGVKTIIRFNDLSSLDTLLINKAELEVTIADIPGQTGKYPNPKQLIATRKNDGNLIFIQDISQVLSTGTSFFTSFGGQPISNGGIVKYNMNITNHIKEAVKNKSFDADIYLSILTEAENPSRGIFYGAKNTKFPVKLKVTYTKN